MGKRRKALKCAENFGKFGGAWPRSMNWNTAFDTTGAPITLRFARLVGQILREIPPGFEPSPRYKFYM